MVEAIEEEAMADSSECLQSLQTELCILNHLFSLAVVANLLCRCSGRAKKYCYSQGQSARSTFRLAGPRQKVYFSSDDVHACIVTCGGLCPGLKGEALIMRGGSCAINAVHVEGQSAENGIGVVTLMGCYSAHY
ncbi:hypothetical protein RDI58_020230 [Solanum bulbocastanum]|uniref:Uncharacterized protein n=1 Tax=Solanum bulbocastanum TaxID=147425 RepID=A0AAN8T9L6_SOLBU